MHARRGRSPRNKCWERHRTTKAPLAAREGGSHSRRLLEGTLVVAAVGDLEVDREGAEAGRHAVLLEDIRNQTYLTEVMREADRGLVTKLWLMNLYTSGRKWICLLGGNLGSIAISALEGAGLTIKRLKMVALNNLEADECISLMRGTPQIAKLLCSDKCVVVAVAGSDAVASLTQVCKRISNSMGSSAFNYLAIPAPDAAAAAGLEDFIFGSRRRHDDGGGPPKTMTGAAGGIRSVGPKY